MDVDVVIVGAGVAGLAAAAAVRTSGLRCLVIEATGMVGGRARTIDVAGAPFDSGASWLHSAETNPLRAIAEAHGDTLIASGARRSRRVYVDGRPATEAELDDYARTYDRYTELATSRVGAGPDTSLAAATSPLRDEPWSATIAYWEACLIAAADPNRLSLQDWHDNQLEGENLEIEGGLGAFVARRLAPPAGDIRCGVAARRVRWDEPKGRVRVETDAGTIVASACIVTVSTGVLAGGAIRFDPALPPRTAEAIAGLPMGLLSKVALPARGAERLGLPESCHLMRRVSSPERATMSFLCWPSRRPAIVGFVGGEGAWELARAGRGALADFARTQLAELLGARVHQAIGDGLESDWAGEAAFLGSYAYALPGHAGARAILAEPLAGGRLAFAGEAACSDGLAGTVGGAYVIGQKTGRAVADALGAAVPV